MDPMYSGFETKCFHISLLDFFDFLRSPSCNTQAQAGGGAKAEPQEAANLTEEIKKLKGQQFGECG